MIWEATGLPSESKTPNLIGELMQGAIATKPTLAGQSDWLVFSMRNRIGAVATGLF
jgi:hypothetical protein